MFHLLGLLLIPILVGGVAYLINKTTITAKEYALMMGISVVVAVAGFYIARWGAMSDVEHWNGRVTAKVHDSEGCCHSYPCNCRESCSGIGKNRSCRTVCDTCYRHSRDYYWALDYSTGDRNVIDSCEPNPRAVPVFWAQTQVGDPASLPHRFTNYLLADPDSLLREGAPEQFLKDVPDFPRVHSFHHVTKAIGHGVPLHPGWQSGLMELNADLGAMKQVDVVMLFTTHKDPAYAQAVEAKWLYGPKNALIIVAGVENGFISWARVVTISRVEELKVTLRDALVGMSMAHPETALAVVRREVESKFHRTSMSEFEYLSSAAKPSDGILIFLYLLVLAVSGGLAYWAHREDIFGDEGFSSRRSRVGMRNHRPRGRNPFTRRGRW
jgi:hypothetical protein